MAATLPTPEYGSVGFSPTSGSVERSFRGSWSWGSSSVSTTTGMSSESSSLRGSATVTSSSGSTSSSSSGTRVGASSSDVGAVATGGKTTPGGSSSLVPRLSSDSGTRSLSGASSTSSSSASGASGTIDAPRSVVVGIASAITSLSRSASASGAPSLGGATSALSSARGIAGAMSPLSIAAGTSTRTVGSSFGGRACRSRYIGSVTFGARGAGGTMTGTLDGGKSPASSSRCGGGVDCGGGGIDGSCPPSRWRRSPSTRSTIFFPRGSMRTNRTSSAPAGWFAVGWW